MVFLIGMLGILITVSLHALLTVGLIATLRSMERDLTSYRTMGRCVIVASTACALAIKHGFDVLLWAIPFGLFAGSQFSSFEDAVYFSSATYTTVGYGDIVVSGPWRMLCTFEAINGLILFGVSTALLFVLFEYLWLREHDRGK